VEYFNYFFSKIIKSERSTHEITARISMAKSSTRQQIGLKIKEKTSQMLHLELELGHFGK